MGNLVRDRIPDIMTSAGLTPDTRILDAAAYRDSLFKKLIEEAKELRDASGPHQLEEAGDSPARKIGVFIFRCCCGGSSKA